MLKIFNDLEPFFKNNYQRINVREYARITKITPPTASKLLSQYLEKGLINKEEEKNYIYYTANKNSPLFIRLSQAYWFERFKKIGILDYLDKELATPTVFLFGSFSKAEITPNSDIDLAIFTSSKRKLNFDSFEKKLNRKIDVFVFKNLDDVKNKELLKNILNGYTILGGW